MFNILMNLFSFLTCISLAKAFNKESFLFSSPKTMISKAQYIVNSKKHLVVLSHGIIGSSRDLSYLEEKLVNKGFTVLQSSSNELHGSLFGVSEAARKLRDEVLSFASRHRDLETISFVGNSLGGLFARYAIMLLYNPDNQKILGLLPKTFLVITCVFSSSHY